MKRIQQLSKEKQQELLKICYEVAKYNRKHFFSANFLDKITNELKCNVTDAFDRHLGELDLNLWWNTSQWYKKNGLGHIVTRRYRKVFLPLLRQQRLLAAVNNSRPSLV